MPQINCYIPIKLRLAGELSEAQLEQLGQTVTRAVTARLEQARRTLREHGYAPSVETVAPIRERIDQSRLSNGRYGVPSYDHGGKTVDAPVTGDTDTQIEAMWQSAVDAWEKQSKNLASIDERARARRIFILLNLGPANPFKNLDEVDTFIDLCVDLGDDEDKTLKTAEQLTDKDERDALLFDEGAAFPNTWAWRVRREFYPSVDLDALRRTFESAKSRAFGLANGLADNVWDRGLPLAKAEASSVRRSDVAIMALSLRHAYDTSNEAISQFTRGLWYWERAQTHYILVQWYKWRLDNQIDEIRQGKLVIDKDEYLSLKGAAGLFQRKLSAFEVAAASSDMRKTVVALQLQLPTRFYRGPGTGGMQFSWLAEEVHPLWEAIAKVDARIASAGKFDCIWRALVWAEARDYFAAAGKEVYEAIKDNWLKMIGTMVAILVAQAIPGLNVAVDLVLAIKFGLDGIQAAFDVGGALKDAGGANTVVEMEHASARLASVLVGLAADIALWAATWGTTKVAKELVQWRKVERFVKQYGDSAETREVLLKAKGNAEEAETLLKAKREHERQERELQQAEQRRQAAETERQRKRQEEEAVAQQQQEHEQEPASARKQQAADKLAQEEIETAAKQRVSAKQNRKASDKRVQEEAEAADRRKAADKWAEIEASRTKPKVERAVKPGQEPDFAASYDAAAERSRQARNTVQDLKSQLSNLPASSSGKVKEDLLDALKGAEQTKSIAEAAELLAEKALRDSTLKLHEKLGAAARNRKEFRDVTRLANGEDKVGNFKVDLTKDHIAPDHIVAIRRITTDPKFRGFEKLRWEDQLEIVNMRDNLVAMKGSFNSSKGDRPWREWKQAKQYYDSKVVDKMIAQELEVERLIVLEIAKRLPKR
ncbi:MAG: hypothetical protein KDI62_04275 [Anaerolineae bacterium]|nr:hypothetical protein [Anaerolineae bacterium]MCB9107918.1 hypothetical protein [Anaerolineales bacterium]